MAMVVPSGLVLEQVLGVHAAVRPDHVVGDLSSFQQVDQKLPGYAKDGCRLHGGQLGLVLDDHDGLPLIQKSNQFNQKRIERVRSQASLPIGGHELRLATSKSVV